MGDPLVSILIPAFNRENFIKDAIESALNQTYKNTEIIIVDNNSSDNTWQTIMYYKSKDPRIKAYRNKKNIGPVLNWQKCISQSSGEYIKFLFSDDYISENYVEESINLFDNNTSFVLSPIKIINNSNLEISLYSDYKQMSVLSKEKYLRNILFFNRLKLPVSPGAGIFRKIDIQKTLEIDLKNHGEIHNNTSSSYRAIASIYEKMKDYNNELLFLKKANKSNNKSSYVYYDLGYCYENLNNYKESILSFIKCAEILRKKYGIDDDSTQKAIQEAIRLAKETNKLELLPDWIKKIANDQ